MARPARLLAACGLLALLCAMPTVAARALTQTVDAVESQAKQCDDTTVFTSTGALNADQCTDCMYAVDAASGALSTNKWACIQLCQNTSLFPSTLDDVADVSTHQCVKCIATNDADTCSQCDVRTDVSTHQCVSCIETIDADTCSQRFFFPGVLATNKWACIQLCHNTSLFPDDSDVRADVSTHCFRAVPTVNTALWPLEANGTAPVWAAVQKARTWCIDECAAAPPGLPDGNGAYLYACAICANLPAGSAERTWCFACINSTYIEVEPKGVASKWEVDTPGWPRLNDFGACASAANTTYWVNQGVINPGGVYAQCATEDNIGTSPNKPLLTTTECIACMNYAKDYDGSYDGELYGLGNQGPQPVNSSKAYACAATCRNPKWLPLDNTNTGAASGAGTSPDDAPPTVANVVGGCVTCIADSSTYDAWGCTNCVQMWAEEYKWDSEQFKPEYCFECVQTDPYQGKVGPYNWACGQCASVSDTGAVDGRDLREQCQMCIKTPYDMAETDNGGSFDPALLTNATWVGQASELICSCIDMIKASQWDNSYFGYDYGAEGSWYTLGCSTCTAMQKQCYKRRNITLSSTPDKDAPTFIRVNDTDKTSTANFTMPEGYRLVKCGEELSDEQKDKLKALVTDNAICVITDGSFSTSGVDCVEGAMETAASANDPCWLVTNLPGWHLIHLDDYTFPAVLPPPFPLEWGIGFPGSIGDLCVSCILYLNNPDGQDAPFFGSAFVPAAYACDQYCMNPYTIHDGYQFTLCVFGLVRKLVFNKLTLFPQIDDVHAVESCIQAHNSDNNTENLERREACIECIAPSGDPLLDPNYPENYDWGCIECSKFTSQDARAKCTSCITEFGGVIDPCQCVDGVRHGWLYFEAVTDLCVDAASLKTAMTSNPPGVGGGVHTEEVSSREECADVAQKKGVTLFGLSTADVDGTSVCYWFTSNAQYLLQLDGLYTSATCNVACKSDTDFTIGNCGGVGAVQMFSVGKTAPADTVAAP
ncbi:hypothetical protein FOA52_007086 [Chlamydomonas sp. UWO 241]|nr:hypothetical protein FOA52_007086 [Chlamydomonas sp. UWO 241]